MSAVDFLLERMQEHAGELAVAAGDKTATYAEVFEAVAMWRKRLEESGLPEGAVVTVEGDYPAGDR